jgi:hypothetical protein
LTGIFSSDANFGFLDGETGIFGFSIGSVFFEIKLGFFVGTIVFSVILSFFINGVFFF